MNQLDVMELVHKIAIDSVHNDRALLDLSQKIADTLTSMQEYMNTLHRAVEKLQEQVDLLEATRH